MAKGWPLSLMRCLARVIRRVMVASGTRKARAISAVVSPPTARRVSAICEAGDSAGWQRSEEHTSELQSRLHLVCRLLLEKKKKRICQDCHISARTTLLAT